MSHTIIQSIYTTTTPTGLYEANYRRLTRLISTPAQFSVNESIVLSLSDLSMTFLEQHKYTTVLQLKQLLQTDISQLSTIDMVLRVCHDASVVEVVGYQGKNPVQSASVYPNTHMLQIDEKKQLNLLLKDILENAIKIEFHSMGLKSSCN